MYSCLLFIANCVYYWVKLFVWYDSPQLQIWNSLAKPPTTKFSPPKRIMILHGFRATRGVSVSGPSLRSSFQQTKIALDSVRDQVPNNCRVIFSAEKLLLKRGTEYEAKTVWGQKLLVINQAESGARTQQVRLSVRRCCGDNAFLQIIMASLNSNSRVVRTNSVGFRFVALFNKLTVLKTQIRTFQHLTLARLNISS